MKKIMMTFAAVLCCWMTLYAQSLTEQQAMERVLQYMNSGKASAMARRMAASPNGGRMKLKAIPVEAEKIYAFNMEGGGYVIASGDQRTLPVLGYSTTGSIDWEQMPENMRKWLKQYDDAIVTLGHRTDFKDGEMRETWRKSEEKSDRRANRPAVEPLIKTHWNQDAPYWDQVPTYQGPEPDLRNKQCYVGCAATAMAQVMNYWQWPKTVPDGLPDYDYIIQYNGSNYTWHVGALPPTTFEWELMINDYNVWHADRTFTPLGTDEQRRAVATLMRYCGQSIEMEYGPAEKGGSGAYYDYVAKALANYFGYNAVQFIQHQNFPDIDEWEEILYSELAAGRPIVYGGQSDSGGHSFVCDGYDGNGLFHINWGWGGNSDGYFALAVLNPYDNTSAGSGSSGIGYCISENAVIYTDPKMEPQPLLIHDFGSSFYQCLPIYIMNDNVVGLFYWFYESYNEVADHALGTIDSDGNLHPLFMVDPNDSIVYSCNSQEGYNGFLIEIDSTMFAAGQYATLYPMLRFRHPGEEWQVIPPVEQTLTVGRDDEGHFFMRSNQKTYDMQLTGIGITKGTGRLDERSDLTIRVHNYESSDYISELYLVPYYLGHITQEEYGSAPVLAQGTEMECGAYIPAEGEADFTFSFVPKYGGTVVFGVYTENRYIGELPLELNNDTLTNYNAYVENKSYLSKEGDQWYWNVELTDRIGVKMSHWVPSDNLYLRVRHYLNDEQVKSVRENTGLKEYLSALPDSIGSGNYTFTYQMPVDVGRPGKYYFDSYLAEIVNEELVGNSCANVYRFNVDDITGIEEVKSEKYDNAVYDLSGRKMFNGRRKGINIIRMSDGTVKKELIK